MLNTKYLCRAESTIEREEEKNILLYKNKELCSYYVSLLSFIFVPIIHLFERVFEEAHNVCNET